MSRWISAWPVYLIGATHTASSAVAPAVAGGAPAAARWAPSAPREKLHLSKGGWGGGGVGVPPEGGPGSPWGDSPPPARCRGRAVPDRGSRGAGRTASTPVTAAPTSAPRDRRHASRRT